jgi:hypothetical protein
MSHDGKTFALAHDWSFKVLPLKVQISNVRGLLASCSRVKTHASVPRQKDRDSLMNAQEKLDSAVRDL